MFFFSFFFFNDTATTEIYTLSLHDALPISAAKCRAETINYEKIDVVKTLKEMTGGRGPDACIDARSEEHTSELQSRLHLVCRLLLEKKKTKTSLKNRVN